MRPRVSSEQLEEDNRDTLEVSLTPCQLTETPGTRSRRKPDQTRGRKCDPTVPCPYPKLYPVPSGGKAGSARWLELEVINSRLCSKSSRCLARGYYVWDDGRGADKTTKQSSQS